MREDEPVLGRDSMDDRIDRALRSYSEPAELPEARVALARVMERARASESQRRVRWVWGAAMAAGLAVMVAVGVVWMMRGPRRVEIAGTPKAPGVAANRYGTPISEDGRALRESHVSNSREMGQPLNPSVDRTHHATRGAMGGTDARRLRVKAGAGSLPKLDVFPTPQPLSEQEAALLAFANQVPAKLQQQVVEAQAHLGDPIVIAELEIAPLESGEKQDSKQPENDRER
jgi:hypothetical protein